MSNEPLYLQINKIFLLKIKSAKILSEDAVVKLENIINAPTVEEKKLEELLCQNETKKT